MVCNDYWSTLGEQNICLLQTPSQNTSGPSASTLKHKLHFRFLLNVTINGARVFKPDGSTRKSNLKIVNLRRNVSSGHGGIAWEEVIMRNIIGSLAVFYNNSII